MVNFLRRSGAVSLSAAVLSVGMAFGPGSAGAATTTGALKPVASVQISRYLGQWYQVAAIPAIYEAFCQKDSIAHYALVSPTTIGVTNTCSTIFGTEVVNGQAEANNSPADSVLTVSFFQFAGKWVYSSTPNYEIIGLDPAYGWAVVASPDHASAFVLSRKPALSATETAKTRAALTASGFNPCSLNVSPQDGGLSTSSAYC